MGHNESKQHRLQVESRDAFHTLRITGYIANISHILSKDKADNPKKFTIAAQLTEETTFRLSPPIRVLINTGATEDPRKTTLPISLKVPPRSPRPFFHIPGV